MIDQIRRLPASEWNKLKDFPDGIVLPPENSRAFIAENQSGEPTGRIFVVSVAHLEGIYVDPSRRGTSLMSRLVCRAERELMDLGATSAFAYGSDEQMENYISRLAYMKERWSVWRKELALCR